MAVGWGWGLVSLVASFLWGWLGPWRGGEGRGWGRGPPAARPRRPFRVTQVAHMQQIKMPVGEHQPLAVLAQSLA